MNITVKNKSQKVTLRFWEMYGTGARMLPTGTSVGVLVATEEPLKSHPLLQETRHPFHTLEAP